MLLIQIKIELGAAVEKRHRWTCGAASDSACTCGCSAALSAADSHPSNDVGSVERSQYRRLLSNAAAFFATLIFGYVVSHILSALL